MKKLILLISLALFAITCQERLRSKNDGLEEGLLLTPADADAQPNLSLADRDAIFLSWTHVQQDSSTVLYFTDMEEDGWGFPKPIHRSRNIMLNWADLPAVHRFPRKDNILLAHWLEKNGRTTTSYDIKLSISSDGGDSWSKGFMPYPPKSNNENGFASVIPMERDMGVFWLAGAEYLQDSLVTDAALLFARIGADQRVYDRQVLDTKVCECCKTDATLSSQGPIVVYRDRKEEEFRDIKIIRRENGKWTSPETVHQDNWKIPGCPVNGPAVAALGSKVAVAWYTEDSGEPKVNLAISDNAGRTFSNPIRLDQGNAVGRVDVSIDPDGAVAACWVEHKELDLLYATLIRPDGEQVTPRIVSHTGQNGRFGYPIMKSWENGFIMTYNEMGTRNRMRTRFLVF